MLRNDLGIIAIVSTMYGVVGSVYNGIINKGNPQLIDNIHAIAFSYFNGMIYFSVASSIPIVCRYRFGRIALSTLSCGIPLALSTYLFPGSVAETAGLAGLLFSINAVQFT